MGSHQDRDILHRCECRSVRPYKTLCSRPTKDHEQGVAGDDQRVPEGMALDNVNDLRRARTTADTPLPQAQKSEAITGVSSEGYKGPGMVQSKPLGKKPGEGEDDE